MTSDHPFMREDFSCERDHYPLVRKHKAAGFVLVPNWMPVGWPTYEWVYPNGLDAMMRPAPRWFDRVRWQWPSALMPKSIKRWKARRALVGGFRRPVRKENMTTLEVAEFGIKTVSAIAEAKLDQKNAEIARLQSELRQAAEIIRRYVTETPLGNQPHMIAHVAEAWLADNAGAVPRRGSDVGTSHLLGIPNQEDT